VDIVGPFVVEEVVDLESDLVEDAEGVGGAVVEPEAVADGEPLGEPLGEGVGVTPTAGEDVDRREGDAPPEAEAVAVRAPEALAAPEAVAVWEALPLPLGAPVAAPDAEGESLPEGAPDGEAVPRGDAEGVGVRVGHDADAEGVCEPLRAPLPETDGEGDIVPEREGDCVPEGEGVPEGVFERVKLALGVLVTMPLTEGDAVKEGEPLAAAEEHADTGCVRDEVEKWDAEDEPDMEGDNEGEGEGRALPLPSRDREALPDTEALCEGSEIVGAEVTEGENEDDREAEGEREGAALRDAIDAEGQGVTVGVTEGLPLLRGDALLEGVREGELEAHGEGV